MPSEEEMNPLNPKDSANVEIQPPHAFCPSMQVPLNTRRHRTNHQPTKNPPKPVPLNSSASRFGSLVTEETVESEPKPQVQEHRDASPLKTSRPAKKQPKKTLINVKNPRPILANISNKRTSLGPAMTSTSITKTKTKDKSRNQMVKTKSKLMFVETIKSYSEVFRSIPSISYNPQPKKHLKSFPPQ